MFKESDEKSKYPLQIIVAVDRLPSLCIGSICGFQFSCSPSEHNEFTNPFFTV